MARKRKLDVGPDGSIDTGIYGVSPAAESLPDQQANKWLAGVFAEVNTTATQRLAALRKGCLDVVRPHVFGPVGDQEAFGAPGGTTISVTNASGTQHYKEPGPFYQFLDFGEGEAVYQLAPHLLLRSNREAIRTEAVKAFGALDDNGRCNALQAIDALEALRDIRLVEQIARDDTWPPTLPDIEDALKAMFRLGRAWERHYVRPFESLVKSEHGRREGARRTITKTNAERRSKAPVVQTQTRVSELVEAGMSKSKAVQQTAEQLDISTDSVYRYLRD